MWLRLKAKLIFPPDKDRLHEKEVVLWRLLVDNHLTCFCFYGTIVINGLFAGSGGMAGQPFAR